MDDQNARSILEELLKGTETRAAAVFTLTALHAMLAPEPEVAGRIGPDPAERVIADRA
jgi:hypothetical protein